MDVTSASGSGFDPRRGHLLSRPRTAELLAKDAARRYPLVGNETPLLGGDVAPGQRASVSAYVRHESTEAARSALG